MRRLPQVEEEATVSLARMMAKLQLDKTDHECLRIKLVNVVVDAFPNQLSFGIQRITLQKGQLSFTMFLFGRETEMQRTLNKMWDKTVSSPIN